MSETPPFAKLAEIDVALREQQAALTRSYDADYAVLADKRKTAQTEMLRQLQEQGLASAKVIGIGTVYTQKTIRANIDDDGIFYGWIREHDAFDFLERRVKSSTVQAYMEGHEGEAPPGLGIFSEINVRIRKSKDSQ